MVKKFCKFIGILVALAILVLTPTPALVQMGVAALVSEDFHHTAPTQKDTLGPIGSYDITTWIDNEVVLTNTTLAQKITADTTDSIRREHPQATLLDEGKLGQRTAVVMTNKYKGALVQGSCTSSEITLSANGFYRVAVEYFTLGDNSFFYLNDNEISLAACKEWDQSAFYIRTDRLATATIKAQLYLGSRNGGIHDSAVYFANFVVEAISEQTYNAKTQKDNLEYDECTLDFTNTDDVAELHHYQGHNFHAVDPSIDTDTHSLPNINSVEVASKLKFENIDTIRTKDDAANEQVMLIAAHDAYAKLALDKKFTPLPRHVYMFQFYSLAASGNDSFYFNIGETPFNVKTIDYNYKFGWQLNTFFYIAGDKADQEYELTFSIGTDSEDEAPTATGWACITDLFIYQVSGSYATNNASAVGVHYTEDCNTTDKANVTNGSFNLGTSADLSSPSYPYPLQAQSWTTDGAHNGIVNTNYWSGINATNPGEISNAYNNRNNNVYMLRNYEYTTNTLTSPTFSTTAGNITYISFNAYALDTVKTQVTLMLDDETPLATMDINYQAWHTYEFAITESAHASSRSYQLLFTMTGIGQTFIDNVRTGSTTESTSRCPKTQQAVILDNPLEFEAVWQANADFYANADANGIMLQNVGDVTTTVTNTLAYNLTAGTYYKLTFDAHGQNAWVQLSGFKGDLAVNYQVPTNGKLQTYTIYFEATSETTQTNFTVLLGSQEANELAEAKLYLSKFTLEDVDDIVYEQAVKQGDSDYRAVFTADTDDDGDDTITDDDDDNGNNFWQGFWSNWWFLVPSLITALAILLAVIAFFIHKIKFDKHITTKTTSYARDVKMKTNQKKIVAEQSAKVDNSITDEAQDN